MKPTIQQCLLIRLIRWKGFPENKKFFHDFLVSRDFIARNIFRDRSIRKSPSTDVVNVSEMQRVCDCIFDDNSIPITGISMFFCFYASGVTLSELRNLRTEDLSVVEKTYWTRLIKIYRTQAQIDREGYRTPPNPHFYQALMPFLLPVHVNSFLK